MFMFVHSTFGGSIRRRQFPSEDVATTSLNRLLDQHKANGERSREFVFGHRPFVEIWDGNGEVIGTYWMDSNPNSRQPSERDGMRSRI